jgi:hypothetical protein
MAERSLTPAARAEVRSVLGRAGLPDDPARFLSLVEDAVRSVVLVRHAVDASALTDVELRELREIGLEPDVEPTDLADATRTATATMAAILADAMSVDEAARQMELHPSRLRQMLLDRSLVGIEIDGEWRIPRFQFSGRRQVRNLGPVLRAAPADLHHVELLNWLARANHAHVIEGAPDTPLAWLEAGGDPEPVAAIAAEL